MKGMWRLAGMGIGVAVGLAAWSADRTWRAGASGDWYNEANWDPPGVPDPSEALLIPSGTVALSAPVVISNRLEWVAGTCIGNRLTVAPGARLVVGGGDGVRLLAAVLVNEGRVEWRGGRWTIEPSDRYQSLGIGNAQHAEFVLEGSGELEGANPGGHYGFATYFQNDGALIQAETADTNTLTAVPLHNRGLADVRKGTLRLGGGGTSTGEFRVARDARLIFTGGTHVWEDVQFRGAGQTLVGGQVTANGTVTSENLRLEPEATIQGSLTLGGVFRWNGGTVAGGILRVLPGATVTVEGHTPARLLAASLLNHGTVHWLAAADWQFEPTDRYQTMTFSNAPGATFRVANSQNLLFINPGGHYGSSAEFHNLGTLVKDEGETNAFLAIRFSLEPGATNRVLSGRLAFPEGLVSDGLWEVASGARVEFTGGTLVLGPGHAVAGGGFFGLPAGQLTVAGATTGYFDWTAGTLLGGALTNPPGSVLRVNAGAAGLRLLGAGLWNHGRLEWHGDGPWLIEPTDRYQNLVISNAPGAEFVVHGQGGLRFQNPAGHYGANANFHNGGLFLQEGTANTNHWAGVGVANAHLFELRTGGLRLDTGGVSPGEFRVSEGAALWLTGGTFEWPGARFTGGGATRVAGSLTASGTVISENLELTPEGSLSGGLTIEGTFRWRGGTLAAGVYRLSPQSRLLIEGSSPPRLLAATLINDGTVRWTTSAEWQLEPTDRYQAVLVSNTPNGLLEIQTDQPLLPSNPQGHYGFSPRFHNAGRVIKSSGGATAFPLADFHHFPGATIRVEAGTMAFPSGLISEAPWDIAAGARVECSGGTVRLEPGHETLGGGYFGMPSGQLTLFGATAGFFDWTGGTLAGSTWTNPPTGRLRVNAAGTPVRLLVSRLVNQGEVISQPGSQWLIEPTDRYQTLEISNAAGARFTLLGSAEVRAHNPAAHYGFTAQFINDGLVTQESPDTMNHWQGVRCNNAGLIEVRSGVLQLDGGGVCSGEFRAAANAVIRIAGGAWEWLDTPFRGAGEAWIVAPSSANGTVNSENLGLLPTATLTGSLGVRGHFRWRGGTVTGGPLRVLPQATLDIEGDSPAILLVATLVNEGTVRWRAAAPWYVQPTDRYQTLTISNAPNATLQIENAQSLAPHNPQAHYGVTFRLHNAGRILKTGEGTTVFDAGLLVDQAGVIEVLRGNLKLTGTLTASPVSELRFGLGPDADGRIESTVPLALAGRFGVTPAPGYASPVGEVTEVLGAPAITGQFVNAESVSPGTSRSFTPHYGPQTVTLETAETDAPALDPGLIVRTPGEFVLRFDLAGAARVTLEASSDLLHWDPITVYEGGAGQISFKIPTGLPYAFFRLQFE